MADGLSRFYRSLAAAAWLGAAASGHAAGGPDWEEPPVGDAGALTNTAQVPTGTGPLGAINGRLAGPGVVAGIKGDFQDLYLIEIVDPAAFFASTSPMKAGSAVFQSALWLFGADGSAALANRQAMMGMPGATILGEATDSTGFVITEPGLYFLGISGVSTQPFSSAGAMFQFGNQIEVSGPDGPGASKALADWIVPAEFGDGYRITLGGVRFPAPPCPGDLNNDGLVNSDDLGILLGDFGCIGACAGDANKDAQTNSDDLSILLGAFGAQCGPFGACCLPSGACEARSVYACLAGGGTFKGDGAECADVVCPAPGVPSSCCVPRPMPGCDDPECQIVVCAVDPFCCAVAWDTDCVGRAFMAPACPCP